MLTNQLDDAANDASWALLELKNSSAKVLPITVDPVSVVTELPRGLHSTNVEPDGHISHCQGPKERGDIRDSNENDQQELAIFDVNGDKYVMRKDLVQIGRNSSKGTVDIDVTRTDSTATGFVSRVHCEVRYSARNRRFYLSCFGKNGVFVDDSFQKQGDSSLQLRPSCILTFPSTQINVRFNSLIRDPDQIPSANSSLSHNLHVRHCDTDEVSGESKQRNGLKLLNGEFPIGSSQMNGRNYCSGMATSRGDLSELALHIPVSTTMPDHSYDQVATGRIVDSLRRPSQPCLAINGSTHSPSTDLQCGSNSNTNSCPVSPNPKVLPAINGVSCSPPHTQITSRQPAPIIAAPATFRQPVNSCSVKLNGSAATADRPCIATPSASVMVPSDGESLSALDTNANKGRCVKPPYSYAQLIAQAIGSVAQRQLTLSGIYAFITKNYPYFRANDKGWQNSIRHNLSLNRFFVKVPRSHEEPGKGMFWRIESEYEEKLITTAYRKRRQRPNTDADADMCASRKSSKSRSLHARSNPDLNVSASVSAIANAGVCSLSSSPGVSKSPPPLTTTLTASASTCSSRSTSPATEHELMGMVQRLSSTAGASSLGATKSVSLPHSPVSTFLNDKVKHRSGDGSAEGESPSRLSFTSILPLRQTATARSTPAFPIGMKQSPLTLPTLASTSTSSIGSTDSQHYAVLIPANANRQYSQYVNFGTLARQPQFDTLTPPNSASNSSQCPSGASASEWTINKNSDQFNYLQAQPMLVDTLQNYLAQQTSSMHPATTHFFRQYSVPIGASTDTINTGGGTGAGNGELQVKDEGTVIQGAVSRKRLSDVGNGVAESIATDQSLSVAQRVNGHAMPLKKRCFFNAERTEITQNGQH